MEKMGDDFGRKCGKKCVSEKEILYHIGFFYDKIIIIEEPFTIGGRV